MMHVLKQLMLWLGIEKNRTSHSEKVISALGAMVGILVTILMTKWLSQHIAISVGQELLIIASFGATAVLVFAVPHGALSQPWQVIAGHLISATVGVACQHLLGATPLAAAIAVGLAVGLMYYTRCIHPPGGATALNAVIGGVGITQLGFSYLLFPVLVNVFAILLAAIVFNAFISVATLPGTFIQTCY